MKLSAISTWNVWGVPLVSPNFFSRIVDARRFFDAEMCALLVERSRDGLVVACFQELWAIRAGPVRPLCEFVARKEMERQVGFCRELPEDRRASIGNNSILSLGVQLLTLLVSWMLPMVLWDQKDQMAADKEGSFPLPFVVGNHGQSIASLSSFRLVDSGLMMLASVEPRESGFEPFPRETLRGEELLNHKGILWAFWCPDGEQVGTLVVTTHMTAEKYSSKHGVCSRGENAVKQLRFVTTRIAMLRERLACSVATGAKLEVFLCGDFNDHYNSPDLQHFMREADLVRLTSDEPTFRDGNAIDHVFTSEKNVRAAPKPTPIHTTLSDHALVVLPSISRAT